MKKIIPAVNNVWPIKFESKKIGSKNVEDVYLSVGRALSSWEVIETHLGIFFKLLIESESLAGERIYCLMSTVAVRKEALSQAAYIYDDRNKGRLLLGDFELLLRHYVAASQFRNHIAHGIVIDHKTELGEPLGAFLVSNMFSRKSIAKTGKFWLSLHKNQDRDLLDVFGYGYRYTHEDIDNFSKLFTDLSELISDMWSEQMQIIVKLQFPD